MFISSVTETNTWWDGNKRMAVASGDFNRLPSGSELPFVCSRKLCDRFPTGIIVGVIATFIAARVVASPFGHFSRIDPITVTFVALILLAVGVIAALIPARRATLIDPLIAIRHE